MPEIPHFLLFLAASLAVNLTPGPDMLYVATRAATQGRVAGVVSALGIGAGTLFHIAAAALGLSTLLLVSATAFSLVKWAGAAYLVYMGVAAIREAGRPLPEAEAMAEPLSRVFSRGVVVNLLNPKVALFFLSFLPQFADPAPGRFEAQVAVLGMAFNLGGTLVNSLVAVFCGWAGRRMLRGRARVVQARVSGGVFVCMGLGLGLAGRD